MIKLKLKYMLLSTILLLLTLTSLSVLAVQPNKPVLRDGKISTMKLEGDINFTKTNPTVTLSLRDSDVQQVLRMFADKAGLNIIFHQSVKNDKKITLDLVRVPINDAFKLILQVSDMTYFLDGKTMIVATAEGAKDFNIAKSSMTSIPVTYLDASVIANFLNKNVFSQNLPGLTVGEIVTTNPLENEILVFGSKNDVMMAQKIIAKFDRKPNSTTYVLNHTTPKEMANLICKILIPTTFGDPKGATGGAAEAETAGATGGTAGGTGGTSAASGAVTPGSSGSISLGEGVVACSIKESVSAGKFSSFPTQSLAVSYYPQLGTINVIGGNKQQLETIADFISEHDVKQIQAYLEMAILELNEDGTKTLNNEWGIYMNNLNLGDLYTGVVSSAPIFLKGNQVPGSSTYPQGPSKFSYPTTITWAVNYLMTNSKGKILANPRMLITNGQTSTLDMTSDYVKKVTSDMADASTGSIVKTTKNYEIADDLGLRLSITPHISPEGYVTFNISPKYSTPKGQIKNGDDIEGTLLSRRNLTLNNIRVKDGETLIIGGLIQETETKGLEKIPFLGDIPVIGFFFRSSSVTRGKSELVIMLTPRILHDEEDVMVYKKRTNIRPTDEL